MLKSVAVVLIVLTAGASAQWFMPCNDQQLGACQAKFNAKLDIQGDADWHDVNALTYVLFKRLLSGTDGLLEVCDARQSYYNCLGPMYFSCMSPEYFVEHGTRMNDSYAFVGIFSGLEFMCAGGLNVGLGNWPCIVRAFRQDGPALEKCSDTFNKEIAQDMSKLCQYSQEFLDCYSKPFGDTCPYNGESKWWACEYLHRSMGRPVMAQCPDLKCPIAPPPSQAPPAANTRLLQVLQGEAKP